MKILFVATVTAHVVAFHIPYLKWFKEQGWEVHVATYGDDEIPYCDKKYDISIARSPFNPSNIKAFFQLKAIMQIEKYNVVHGHTPMGGVLTRLCANKSRKIGTKVLYTAHGFHFHKGSPLVNWVLYYPMEKICSCITDVLVTINQEDYALAKTKMKAKKVHYIPGIGFDSSKFANTFVDIDKKRKELGILTGDIMLLSVGELTKTKNHSVIVEAIAKLNNPHIKYFICGEGELRPYLERLIQQAGLSNQVFLLGFRKDIGELCKIADIFCFPSYREGLAIAPLEAMACGLPLIASNARGILNNYENRVTGISCDPSDINAFADAIEKLTTNPDRAKKIGLNNIKIAKKFDISNSLKEMAEIYGHMGVNQK